MPTTAIVFDSASIERISLVGGFENIVTPRPYALQRGIFWPAGSLRPSRHRLQPSGP